MSDPSKAHIDQWKHNRGFLQTIQPPYPDWAVTVTFYTALHAVDALLAHDKVQGITSHEARNGALMRTNRYANIWKSYQPLHSLARTVRYLAKPQRWVPWHEIEPNVIRRYLYPIEKSVQKLTMPDLQLPPVALASAEPPSAAE